MRDLDTALRTLAERAASAHATTALAAPGPRRAAPPPSDLTAADGRWLLAADDAGWCAALADATPQTVASAGDSLREVLGIGSASITFTADEAAALRAIEAYARARTGRTRRVVIDRDWGAEEIRAAIADGDLAVCIAEPLAPESWAQLRRAADEAGFVLIADERRTLFRTAPGLQALQPPFAADGILLGDSMVSGVWPCGAIIGVLCEADPIPPPDRATLGAIVATLRYLRARADSDTRLATLGERLRMRFVASCARENIAAELRGPAALMRFTFAGQENAEAPLMAHHFGLELQRIGAEPGHGDVALHHGIDDARAAAIGDLLDRAVARMRCLLIEHNSYLCGEIAYVFPDPRPAVVERGLALYRFPKLGAVDLTPVGDGMRIHFLGGELGEVTSSGFYIPTLFTGDFELVARYRIDRWEPGPDSACLGLFAQNLASSARYYAQRMSSGDRPDDHYVLGSLATVLSARRRVTSPSGSLRLVRRGAELTAWHRADVETEWTLLATDEHATRDDVIFGAKIWSKIECGDIDAVVSGLTIDAELADPQIPRLEHRPDPRRA